MNYFLLANNKDIKQSTIDKLPLNEKTDTLVLFNFLFPLRFNNIKNYPNKICISRRRPVKDRLDSQILPGIKEYYCNMGTMKRNQDLFKEIYFLPCPHNLTHNPQSYTDNINLFNFDLDKVKCIDYNLSDMSKKLNYYRTGIQAEVSTGIIVHEYIKSIKQPEYNIILVAFNSGLTNFHDKKWETQYFLNEIEKQKCLTIDCYNVPDTYNGQLQ
jgi:hypothetical protein